MKSCRAILLAKLLGAVSFQTWKQVIVELITNSCPQSPSLRKPAEHSHGSGSFRSEGSWWPSVDHSAFQKSTSVDSCIKKLQGKRKDKYKGQSLHPSALSCLFSPSLLLWLTFVVNLIHFERGNLIWRIFSIMLACGYVYGAFPQLIIDVGGLVLWVGQL